MVKNPSAVFDYVDELFCCGADPVESVDVLEFRSGWPLTGDIAIHPGQDIEYVVVNDENSSRKRVALAHEEVESYDASYYETQLVRAVESVLSSIGWGRTEIRRELAETRVPELTVFANTEKS